VLSAASGVPEQSSAGPGARDRGRSGRRVAQRQHVVSWDSELGQKI